MKKMKLNRGFKKVKLTKEVDEEIMQLLNEKIVTYAELRDYFYEIDLEDKKNMLDTYRNELNIEMLPDEDCWSDFEEFLEANFTSMSDAVNAAHFGNYNPSADLFCLDGYNNIKSISYNEIDEEYKQLIDDNTTEIIDLLIEDGSLEIFEDYRRQQDLVREYQKKYETLKNKRQQDFDKLPLRFAFSDSQFKEMMSKWGLDEEKDLEKIISIGASGFIQKKDWPKMKAVSLLNRAKEQKTKLCKELMLPALVYEFGNYEYIYSHDDEAVLEGVGLDNVDIKIFETAKKLYYARATRLEY